MLLNTLIIHTTVLTVTAKNYVAPSVNSATAEKPCLRGYWELPDLHGCLRSGLEAQHRNKV